MLTTSLEGIPSHKVLMRTTSLGPPPLRERPWPGGHSSSGGTHGHRFPDRLSPLAAPTATAS